MVVPVLLALAIVATSVWLSLRRPDWSERLGRIRTRSATIAALACSIPCCAVTLAAVLLVFVLPHRYKTWEAVMVTDFIALGLSPFAVAALIFSAFAATQRGLCLSLSGFTFVGWIVILLLG